MGGHSSLFAWRFSRARPLVLLGYRIQKRHASQRQGLRGALQHVPLRPRVLVHFVCAVRMYSSFLSTREKLHRASTREKLHKVSTSEKSVDSSIWSTLLAQWPRSGDDRK